MRTVFIFESTRSVIRAERLCRQAGLEVKVIPVPRSVSPNCGMALEVMDEMSQAIRTILEEQNLPVKMIDRDKVNL